VEDVRNPRIKRWLREPTEKANRDEFDLAADRYRRPPRRAIRDG